MCGRRVPSLFDGVQRLLRTGGRSKDLLIIRGKNYYPQDLEETWEATSRHAFRPGCSAVVTCGDNVVQVLCEARKNAGDLADACAASRRAVKQVHGITVRKATVVATRAMIKTSSGKIARNACREHLAQGLFTVLHASEVSEPRNSCDKALTPEERAVRRATLESLSDSDVLTRCRGIAARVAKLGAESFKTDAPLTHLGLGSMEGLHLCTELENAFGVALDPELLADDELTLQALVKVLRRGGSAGARAVVVDGARLALSKRDALRQTADARRITNRKRDRVDGAVRTASFLRW